MKGRNRKRLAVYKAFLIAGLFTSLFLVISILTDSENRNVDNYPQITDEVLNYRPLVEKYAKEYDVSQYVDVLLAMMMQESAGKGNDPMQSSESYCGQVGCISDPERSIKQGVYYFSTVLKDAEGDVELAIQSYNFGKGFIDYVLSETGQYSQEVAINFSQKMYENAADKSIYTCLREGSEKYNACYGDIYYVQSVMEYREVIAMK
ncbi:lysozyme family protein [Oceanobacillus bengalensis]|uniref:Lysozyme family protein n=1 Tax=Oceanobacillus bengalensis TaxID=1435466 RepID=A0A494Z016_9BACI|nr:lysozyme family protein [Oceanobacillus bengalensis]RKQ15860.1 lysozyme family protein [Oceanobacillus bengalensis]